MNEDRALGWRYYVTAHGRLTCRVLGYAAAAWYLSLHWHGTARIRKFSIQFVDGRRIDLIPRWMCAAI